MDRDIHLQEDIPNVKKETVDQSVNDQETYVAKDKHEFNILHKFKVKEEENMQDFKDDIEIKEEEVFCDSERASNLQIDPRPKNNDSRIKTAEIPSQQLHGQNINEKQVLDLLTESDSDSDFSVHENEEKQREENNSEIENTSDCESSEIGEILSDASNEFHFPRSSDRQRHMYWKRNRSSSAINKGVWKVGDSLLPNVQEFDRNTSGITDEFQITDDECESDYFKAYFDTELMQTVANETNQYYKYMRDSVDYPEKSRVHRWFDTTVEELYGFIAVLMLMVHIEKDELSSYWKKDKFLGTPQFSKLMRRGRFMLLLRFLHFADNTIPNRDDRLWKIRPFMNAVVDKFSKYFYPFNKLPIDESLILFKGRLILKKYIPTKRSRLGIKMFILCDCESGIVLDMIVYTGTDIDIPVDDSLGLSGSVVKKMMEKYLGKGHSLYTDNSSPALTTYPHENKTNSCGTVRKKRKNMAKFTPRQTKGNVEKLKSDNLLAINCTDKCEVSMLTTMHTGDKVESAKVDHKTKEKVFKPDVVIDYRENMRLVDKSDCQLANLHCLQKSVKWYIKLFYHLVDITLLNAYNMYLVKTGNKPKLHEFGYAVMSQLAKKYCRTYNKDQQQDIGTQDDSRPPPPSATPAAQMPASGIGSRRAEPFDRFSGREGFAKHVPERLSKRKTCDNCATARKKMVKCSYKCIACNVCLCLYPCFWEYHTKQQ